MIVQPDTSTNVCTTHMARPQVQKLRASFATTEQREVEDPMSSGDTVAMDYDIAMVNGPVDEGYHTNHENKKAGTF